MNIGHLITVHPNLRGRVMKDIEHSFDFIRKLNRLNDNEISDYISKENIDLLNKAVDLLSNDQGNNLESISEENFIKSVKSLDELIKAGSRMLGEAIIEASDLRDVKRYNKAIEVYNKFLDQCNIKFYREIARTQMNEIKKLLG